MNHKRGKPKHARAGCLMCKYWKVNGFGKYSDQAAADMKRIAVRAKSELREAGL